VTTKKKPTNELPKYATLSDAELLSSRIRSAENDACRVERLYWSMTEKVGFWSALVGVLVVVQLVVNIVFAVAIYGAHK
jgi:hypothetical protein